MIKKIYTGIYLSLSCFLSAQINLVPNPSFEDTVGCPYQWNSINKSTGWMSFTDSPDYFNSCSAPSTGFSSPSNAFGYQKPLHGKAYAGALLNTLPFTHNGREYFGAKLTQTLTIGTKYYVSFYVSLANSNRDCPCNKVGARFTTYTYSAVQWNTALMTNFAQVYSNSLLTDSINWVQIKGSFTADSLYKYIVLGNFFNELNTDTLGCANSWTTYAYFDAVFVSSDSTASFDFTEVKEIEKRNEIKIYPNPVSNTINVTQEQYFENGTEVEITNFIGESVLKVLYKNEIDVSGLSNGYYTLKISSKDGTRYYSKFIKE